MLMKAASGGSHGFAKEFAASQRKSGEGNALISVSLKSAPKQLNIREGLTCISDGAGLFLTAYQDKFFSGAEAGMLI